MYPLCLESGYPKYSVLPSLSGVGSDSAIKSGPGPVSSINVTVRRQEKDRLLTQCRTEERCAGPGSLASDIIKDLQESFAGFFDSLSCLGKDKNSSTPPTIVAGVTCALISMIPFAGPFALSVMGQSIHDAYAAIATFFGPDGSQIGRTVFSGIVLASAALRAMFPLVKEALLSIPDPHVQFVLTVLSFTLAACHLAVSSISTAIASNNLPALFSNIKDHANIKNVTEKVTESLTGIFAKVIEKFDKLSEKGVAGLLGVVREWLLASAAVVTFLSVLPLLVKTVGVIVSAPIAAIAGGAITLTASILEVIQGINEYRSLEGELKKLKSRAAELDKELSSEGEQLKLRKDTASAIRDFEASKVRIAKGFLGILTSAASITLGALTMIASISIPYLPAVVASISLFSLVVYLSVTLAFRTMLTQEAEKLALAQAFMSAFEFLGETPSSRLETGRDNTAGASSSRPVYKSDTEASEFSDNGWDDSITGILNS